MNFHFLKRLFIFFLFIIFLIYSFPTSFKLSYKTENSIRKRKNVSNICIIYPPNPWDESILEYVRKDHLAEYLECENANVQPELSYIDSEGFLILNHSLLKKLELNIDCQFRSYDKMKGNDDDLVYSNWASFNGSTKITTEFVEVSCQRASFPRTRVYSNNHHQIIPIQRTNVENEYEKPSVIIIVIDSVSHSNFIRNMNNTLQILKNNYQSFIFDGMSKVGDNSFNNAVAFFAGKWADKEFGDVHGFFDNHDLIWKRFKSLNYSTLYSEDYPGFNLFNYLSKGFKEKPVDHYFRPFWLNVYWSYVHRRSRNLCYGNNQMHRLQMQYLSQFIKKYKGKPKFGISWFTELGHDWLNQIRYGDKDLANFLNENAPFLENSFLIIMSDHGHRFDSIRKTTIGRIEERLPFFSLSLPKNLRNDKKLNNILKANSRKLTTFWDVYATFLHISNYAATSKLSSNFKTNRGISLLTPVQDRNCETASIPDEFCVCEDETVIDPNTEKIQYLGRVLARDINKKLEKYLQCAQLTFKKVHSATHVGDIDEDRIRITIEVTPSGGIFESLMQYSPNNSTVIGDINRINKYGNQSICINEQLLRKLCFCTIFIESQQ